MMPRSKKRLGAVSGCWPSRKVLKAGGSDQSALGVSFHQVVHPVLSGEAGVAKLQHRLGGPDERSSECPAHAAQSSRTGAAGGGGGADAHGRRGRGRRGGEDNGRGGGGRSDPRGQKTSRARLPAPP